jgi:hypothetical protein
MVGGGTDSEDVTRMQTDIAGSARCLANGLLQA